MAGDHVLELTNANWSTEVEQSDIPVLVDFWAPWCGPCRRLAPTIDSLATKYHGKLKVGKLNTDESADVAGKFRISGIPAVIIFKSGVEVNRMVGLQPEAAFDKALQNIIGS